MGIKDTIGLKISDWLETSKASKTLSMQPRLDESKIEQAHYLISMFARRADDCPPLGDDARDGYLRKIWKTEPIMSGAIYAFVSKLRALGWTLEGGRNKVSQWTKILHEAEDGQGWNVFISKIVEDYLTTDDGSFIELGKKHRNGSVEALFHIDSVRCQLLGAGHAVYKDFEGNLHPLKPGDYAHFCSMPSPNEDMKGKGFCFVSRALKAAKLLLALHQYEAEKLENLPPEGIATITGLTPKQVEKAFELYKAKRQSRDQLTFPGILWLVGNPMAPGGAGQVKVDLVPFSNLPEQFDRQGLIETYAKTLAADLGTDVSEFWQPERGGFGPSKGEVTIQHQKAKGKGTGEVIVCLERLLNWYVLPEGVLFAFDAQDDEDDLRRAGIQKIEIANVKELAEPLSEEGGIITLQEAREILVSKQILPEDYAFREEATAVDTESEGSAEGQAEKSWAKEPRIKIHSSGRVLWVPTHRENDVGTLLRELRQYRALLQ